MLLSSLAVASGVFVASASMQAHDLSVGELVIYPEKQIVQQGAAFRAVGALDALTDWRVDRRITRDVGEAFLQPYQVCDLLQTPVVAVITVQDTQMVNPPPTREFHQVVQVFVYDCGRHDVVSDVLQRGVVRSLEGRDLGFDRVISAAVRTVVRDVSSAYGVARTSKPAG